MSVPDKIKNFLVSHNIVFKFFEHEPTPTSELAAKVRGVPLSQGAKAMVLRSEGNFFMGVLQASKKIDMKKLKGVVLSKSVSFASADEVVKVTGCVPGGVPPFGNLFAIPVYVDKGLLDNTIMDFNAGLQTCSMEMQVVDWLRVVQPKVVDFALE